MVLQLRLKYLKLTKRTTSKYRLRRWNGSRRSRFTWCQTAAHFVQPDIGFAVDVGIAGDTPGVTDKEAMSKMGEGPQIVIYDASMVAHAGLRDFVTDVADELSIPYQFEAIPMGGTDSGSIHLTGNGIPSLSITIATRYIHSHSSMLHRDDFENAVKLITEVVKRLDKEKVTEIRLG